MQYSILVADENHFQYAETIGKMMEDAAKIRGTGIAKRKPEYIQQKMEEGKAIIAIDNFKVIGFCYIESWEDEKYVANSGLITHPDYRKTGLGSAIKKATFELSYKKFPNSKLFGITTSMAVMKINSDLGYRPVTFSELTQDEKFWNGCQSCTNYDILLRTNKTLCLCTGMIYDFQKIPKKTDPQINKKSWENFLSFMKQRKIGVQTFITKYPKFSKLFKNAK